MEMDAPHPPQAASHALAAELALALSGKEAVPGRLLRVTVPITGIQPLEWLRLYPAHTQYYWSDRKGNFEMAGIGEADVLVPAHEDDTDYDRLFDRMRGRLGLQQPTLRYYGGFRFHPGAVRGERWRAFRAYRFVVPEFEVTREANRTVLACNYLVPESGAANGGLTAVLSRLSALRFESATSVPVPRMSGRVDQPSEAEWRRLVRRLLDLFDRGKLQKVVLARETSFTAAAPINAVELLVRLITHTEHSFDFCFHPAGDRAFIGASPERLYKRQNVYLQSEALAGTRRRGATDEEDQALAEDLLRNEKELREHRFVLDTLTGHFDALCHQVHVEDGPGLLRLRNVQHLHTRIEGILNDVDADATLIRTLHPTPAVGGTPRREALAWLEANEPFDRGIYAAPVGWVSGDAAEFCVGIRSGLVQGSTLTLYNGAGIVAGSDPAEEWDEIESKMGNFLAVLREA
jgi:menaquinone-specific isochorismate synthase